MSEQYGSQYGEDIIILEAFKRLRGEGFCGRMLEVGAYDPIVFSNSRRFIDAGWSAVLIECSPGPLRNLVREYAANKSVTVIAAAASASDNGTLTKFKFTNDAVSTNSSTVSAAWEKDGGYYGEAWVPQISLANVLNQFGGGYDYVSIDTEGSSVDLAVHLLTDLEQFPNVLVVEHDNRMVELMQVAQGLGYRNIHMNGTNIVLERVP